MQKISQTPGGNGYLYQKQQMQWTHQGTHYLLRTRAAVVNNELNDHFERWYPGFQIGDSSEGVDEEARERPYFFVF